MERKRCGLHYSNYDSEKGCFDCNQDEKLITLQKEKDKKKMNKWNITCNWCNMLNEFIYAENLGKALERGKKEHNHNTDDLYLNIIKVPYRDTIQKVSS